MEDIEDVSDMENEDTDQNTMEVKNSFEVVRDLENMLENDNQYDVVIKAGVNPEATKLKAHSFILRARCSYFKKALDNNWSEKTEDGLYFFQKPNISVEVFQFILRYLYTGKVDYNQSAKDVLVPCLMAADELGLVTLIRDIQAHLLKKPDILKTIAISTLEKASCVESLRDLTDACLKTICRSPEILRMSEPLATLEKSVLTMVLTRDDLCMTETEVWDLLKSWAFMHYLTSEQYSTWTQLELKKQIQKVIEEHIPLISFCDMSKEDFRSKVCPFRELLPQELMTVLSSYYKDLHAVEMPWPKCCRSHDVDSVLLNGRGFRLFDRWINKNTEEENDDRDDCKFILLLRASRDGFDVSKFHSLCDDTGATLVVARIRDSETVVGGYNPLPWLSSDEWLQTEDSFIFNLDLTESEPVKVGRVNRTYKKYAVYNNHTSGPYFGKGEFVLYGNASGSAKSNGCYESVDLPSTFSIQDYEVFQVVTWEMP